MREFHMVIRSVSGSIFHRRLYVNDGITLEPSDLIIYQEMVDTSLTSSLPLVVRADGLAD